METIALTRESGTDIVTVLNWRLCFSDFQLVSSTHAASRAEEKGEVASYVHQIRSALIDATAKISSRVLTCEYARTTVPAIIRNLS